MYWPSLLRTAAKGTLNVALLRTVSVSTTFLSGLLRTVANGLRKLFYLYLFIYYYYYYYFFFIIIIIILLQSIVGK